MKGKTINHLFFSPQDKVMSGCGTWIDWQYLFDAAKLLAKCRYTLQYTYPYAYYIEPCPRKELVSSGLYRTAGGICIQTIIFYRVVHYMKKYI